MSARDLAVGFLLGIVLCGLLAVASVLVMWPEPDPLDCIALPSCPAMDAAPAARALRMSA
jgi:hypothetical protein